MTPMLSRAKDKDTGFWREGYYACESNHACFGNELKYEHFIFVDEFMDWNLGGLQRYTVDPKTVGRFIGLYDKNGKMIFEGDIVRVHDCIHDHNFNGYVSFANGSFMVRDDPVTHYRWMDYFVEVIGNIHDTPELLEGGESDA